MQTALSIINLMLLKGWVIFHTQNLIADLVNLILPFKQKYKTMIIAATTTPNNHAPHNEPTANNKFFILFPPSLTLFISFTILNGVFIKKVAKYLKKYEIFKNILISTFYTS